MEFVVEDPGSFYCDPEVQVAPGVIVGPNVQLLGATSVGAGTKFEGSAYVVNSIIAEEALVRFCVRIESAFYRH